MHATTRFTAPFTREPLISLTRSCLEQLRFADVEQGLSKLPEVAVLPASP